MSVVHVTESHPLLHGMKDRDGFALTTRGGTELRHRGRSLRSAPERVLLVRAGEVYRELGRAPGTHLSVFLVDARLMTEARDALGLDASVEGPTALSREDPRVEPLLSWGRRAALEPGLQSDAALTETVSALATLLSPSSEALRPEPRAVRRARAYLLERITERVRLDELADHVGLDKHHLVRAFHAEVGVPPYEYVTQARVCRARRLLRSGVTASQAASALGYCDQSQLHRHFTRIVGVTPGAYARAARS